MAASVERLDAIPERLDGIREKVIDGGRLLRAKFGE